MLRRLVSLFVAAVVAAGVVAVASASGASAADAASCHEDSWIAGSVELCDGAFVYRDYVFDDYGANDPTQQPTAETTGALSRPAGDIRYPDGAVNTADLVDLTLRVVGDELEATFELNALYEPDQTIAALAIDTDADPSTGGGTWSDDSHDLQITSDGWEVLAFFDEGDPDSNLVVGRIPLPEGDTWRVQAATAQADGTVMNVAFRGTGEQTVDGAWFEDLQAAALEAGDVSDFAATVDVADMRSGVTRPAPLEPGYHERVYVSDYTIGPGEGMGYEPVWGRDGDSGEICEQAFHFFGRYQPYGVYVPDQQGSHGMQLALHGCNANHSSLVGQPGMQARFGDDLNRVVVVPLGRGPLGYYSDVSERDVLDVMADVESTYDIDPDRVFSGGYSMGGYGAYRFAQLYPQRFAGMVNWVGFTGDGNNNPTGQRPREYDSGAVGNVIELVRNLRHIPSALLYGGADELVHTHTHVAMAQSFAEEGGPYEYFLHPYGEHFTFALADGWEKEAAFTDGLTRVTDPVRVTYRTAEWLGNPDYAIAHDRAYWLHDITGREDAWIDLDVTNHGCGGEVPVYEEGNDAGVGPAAFAWTSQYRRISEHEPVEAAPRIEADLTNVASVTVDADATCLAGEDVAYAITTDGPTTLRLSDGRTLALDGDGEHTGTLAASGPGGGSDADGAGSGGSGDATMADGSALPATGGGAGLVGLVLVGVALVAATRRAPSRPVLGSFTRK